MQEMNREREQMCAKLKRIEAKEDRQLHSLLHTGSKRPTSTLMNEKLKAPDFFPPTA